MRKTFHAATFLFAVAATPAYAQETIDPANLIQVADLSNFEIGKLAVFMTPADRDSLTKSFDKTYGEVFSGMGPNTMFLEIDRPGLFGQTLNVTFGYRTLSASMNYVARFMNGNPGEDDVEVDIYDGSDRGRSVSFMCRRIKSSVETTLNCHPS